MLSTEETQNEDLMAIKSDLENKWFDVFLKDNNIFNNSAIISALALDSFGIIRLLENKQYSNVETLLSKIAIQPMSSGNDNVLLRINLIKIDFEKSCFLQLIRL